MVRFVSVLVVAGTGFFRHLLSDACRSCHVPVQVGSRERSRSECDRRGGRGRDGALLLLYGRSSESGKSDSADGPTIFVALSVCTGHLVEAESHTERGVHFAWRNGSEKNRKTRLNATLGHAECAS